jgi:hypothetical protein
MKNHNWETEEVLRWITNDESLYDMSEILKAEAVETFRVAFSDNLFPDVDMEEVDWEYVASELME